jgi:hypothetical protein
MSAQDLASTTADRQPRLRSPEAVEGCGLTTGSAMSYGSVLAQVLLHKSSSALCEGRPR